MENTDLVGESTLKQLIEKAGLTQRELAKRTGIKEVTINTWVAGKSFPRLDNAAKVANELQISLKDLSQSFGIDTSKIPD